MQFTRANIAGRNVIYIDVSKEDRDEFIGKIRVLKMMEQLPISEKLHHFSMSELVEFDAVDALELARYQLSKRLKANADQNYSK